MRKSRRIARANQLQPYPRENGALLARHALFPKLSPAMTEQQLRIAAEKAFKECGLTRTGKAREVISSPKELADATLKHLKERTDPIDGAAFFASVKLEEVFLDAIFHEMHKHKMQMGDYYHKLILEIMKASRSLKNANIENANDGPREGDVIADIKTPSFEKGIRLYGSVKKSADTVGGQDFGDALKRLEKVAREDQGRRKPFLCVFMIGNPIKGTVRDYRDSRSIRADKHGRPYSENGEVWEPGFIFPYITGRSARDVFRISLDLVGQYLPYVSLRFREESERILGQRLRDLRLVGGDGKLDPLAFLRFLTQESQPTRYQKLISSV